MLFPEHWKTVVEKRGKEGKYPTEEGLSVISVIPVFEILSTAMRKRCEKSLEM